MAASFVPTLAELALVNQVFSHADTQRVGVLTADAAVKLFSDSGVQNTVLTDIWAIADEEDNGFLTKKGLFIALRLLGHAQTGRKVQKSLLQKRGALLVSMCIFEIHGDGIAGPLATLPGMNISADIHRTGGSPPLVLDLAHQDKSLLSEIFQRTCRPNDGLLVGISISFT